MEDSIVKMIEMELAMTDISSGDEKETEKDVKAGDFDETELFSEELPDSVISYLKAAEDRVKHLEECLLQDREDAVYSACYTVIPFSSSHYLKEIASKFKEDPEILKHKILCEIEEEENKSQSGSNHAGSPFISEYGKINGLIIKEEKGDEVAVTLDYIETEERCRQELLQWEEEQNKMEENKMSELKMLKVLHEKQLKDEEEKKLLRQQQFDEERRKLEMKHMQQQAELEEKIRKDQTIFQEELKQQEAVIRALELRMYEERKLFEEQKVNEEKKQQEKQHNAAVLIQAQFRAFAVYKKYAPILMRCREERQRKKELKVKMDREKKEMEEKIKQKLAEQKLIEEEERKKREVEKLQREEAELRRIQYEKKKEEERLKYEKEKQIMFEQQQKEKEENERLKRNEFERKAREQEENRKAIQRKEQEMKRQCKETAIQTEDIMQEENMTNLPSGNINAFLTTESENEMANRKKNKPVSQSDTSNREQSKQSSASSENVTIVTEVTSEVTDAAVNAKQCDQNDAYANSNFIKGEVSEGMQGESLEILTTDKYNQKKVDRNLPPEAFSSNDSLIPTTLNFTYKISNNDTSITSELTCELPHSQLILPDHIEKKRLSWMQSCTPWARICNENKRKQVVKKNRSRKTSSCQLPPLSMDVILHSGNWGALQQVTTVALQDLPGFSLSTFSLCPQLRCLSLRRCGLIALEGLNDCKELTFIDVQENAIKTINCLDVENLCVLLLNHNQLTSIHGIDGCRNLKVLELSHNNITRIGNTESLKILQHMAVSHNQLISTKGLNKTPTLLYLDCSFNHLTSVDGIEHCGLLQILKVEGNNLTEFPNLENNVLLRELYLDDNSIYSLKRMSECWLPLLKVLSLSQNSLTSLPPMSEVILLEKLHLSNNCLADMKSASEWFSGCQHLLELNVDGNPLQQDTDWRDTLLRITPSLKFLNGKSANSSGEIHMEKRISAPEGSFLAFCHRQHQEIELVLKNHAAEVGNTQSVLEAAEIQCQHLGELMCLAEEHRYAHEYGDLCINDRNDPKSQRNPLKHLTSDSHHGNNCPVPGAKENKQSTGKTSKRWMTPGQRQPTVCANFCETREEQSFTLIESKGGNSGTTSTVCKNKRSNQQPMLPEESIKNSVTISANMVGKHLLRAQQNNLENFAATVVQAHWRGYVVRRDLSFFAMLHVAAIVIQSVWRGHCTRKKMGRLKKFKAACVDGNRSEQYPEMARFRAATLIQAAWKGFHLRKKLASALAAVRKDETEDEFEEVNLDDFVYNEDTLEKEWLILDSEHFPSKTLMMSNHLHWPKPPSNAPVISSSSGFPWQPPEAWHKDDNISAAVKPGSSLSLTGMWQCASSKSRTVSRLSEKSQTTDTNHSFTKQKEKELSEEWGFKDMQTAQLMLKRAQKMKSKKARSKQLLDPAVRLALFKHNENKHPHMSPPKKVQPARVDYFKVSEEEFVHWDSTSAEKIERSRQFTYQWLQTQVEDYKTASSRIMKSSRFLPELNPDVLSGGRVQLVTSPSRQEAMDLEIVSIASGSSVTQVSEKNNQSRRHSVEVAKKHIPLKSNSAPSKKERISFRDNPVQQSIGWGSGKKRGNPFK
ncbi:leucine-rich repeat and IQ domain-containing protein 1 isoform X2 [Protopterus annectens]|uniref:leucine-rich repeat and IQ domain-containing protein 1 isoform X2 n=1 Tax=Protopterus annectens TaxID=7888 RepID=UPI001CFAD541|nr:leucine-rich repeat and IQ domain-containing protein 1 isoform X2 [Protopterus annectens]